MNILSTGRLSEQGSAPSLADSQIFSQLNRLYTVYTVLQGHYPDYCRENPFWSLVGRCSPAELGVLAGTWNQWINNHQVQLCVPAPMV